MITQLHLAEPQGPQVQATTRIKQVIISQKSLGHQHGKAVSAHGRRPFWMHKGTEPQGSKHVSDQGHIDREVMQTTRAFQNCGFNSLLPKAVPADMSTNAVLSSLSLHCRRLSG